jgi:hypothetical protein
MSKTVNAEFQPDTTAEAASNEYTSRSGQYRIAA